MLVLSAHGRRLDAGPHSGVVPARPDRGPRGGGPVAAPRRRRPDPLEPPPRLPGPPAILAPPHGAHLLPAPGRDRPPVARHPVPGREPDPPDGPLAPSVEQWARARSAAGAGARGTVFATLHLALWESQTWFKLLSPVPLPEFGIIFRPLDLAAADAYVKRTRERFGMRLLSRAEGFAEALRILRAERLRGRSLRPERRHAGRPHDLLRARLLDDRAARAPGRKAGRRGAHVLSPPHRILAGRLRVRPGRARRHGGGRSRSRSTAGSRSASADEALARLLALGARPLAPPGHSRSRLRLESKRDLLAADLRARGLAALPRRTRVWVRLPNWLGDVVMAVPLLRALRRLPARCRDHPPRQSASSCRSCRHGASPTGCVPLARPRLRLLRAISCGCAAPIPTCGCCSPIPSRGDLEAWLAGCPQRFGIVRPGRSRPLLTHAYRAAGRFRRSGSTTSSSCGRHFLRHFGLAGSAWIARRFRRAPAAQLRRAPPGPIGLIPGSENEPAKRWPVAHWRRLIDALPQDRFVLFGTAGDAPVTAAIAAGLPAGTGRRPRRPHRPAGVRRAPARAAGSSSPTTPAACTSPTRWASPDRSLRPDQSRAHRARLRRAPPDPAAARLPPDRRRPPRRPAVRDRGRGGARRAR